MQALFFLTFFIATIALIIGLIKPKLVKMSSRKKSFFVFGFVVVLSLFMIGQQSNNSKTWNRAVGSKNQKQSSSLHQQTGKEWVRATQQEKLAFCMDSVRILHKRTDKHLAEELVSCLNEAFSGEVKEIELSEATVLCLALMGKLPEE